MNRISDPHRRHLSRRSFMYGASALGMAAALPLASGCGAGSGSSGARSVTLRFNWTTSGEYSAFYVAQKKGFYEDVGLEVELLEGKSGTQTAQVIGAGSDDFGYVPSIQYIQGVNQGIPILATATCGRYTGMCWAAHKQTPLENHESLYGLTASLSSASTIAQVWDGFVNRYDVDLSQITIIAPDPAARLPLFSSGELDVLLDPFYANDLVQVQDTIGEELSVLRMSEMDFDPLGFLLVTHRDTAEEDPDLVSAMTQATVRGIQFVLDEPEETLEIMVEEMSDILTPAALEGQIANLRDILVQDEGPGRGTDAMWQESLDLLSEAGVIDEVKNVEEYYTNEFVDAD